MWEFKLLIFRNGIKIYLVSPQLQRAVSEDERLVLICDVSVFRVQWHFRLQSVEALLSLLLLIASLAPGFHLFTFLTFFNFPFFLVEIQSSNSSQRLSDLLSPAQQLPPLHLNILNFFPHHPFPSARKIRCVYIFFRKKQRRRKTEWNYFPRHFKSFPTSALSLSLIGIPRSSEKFNWFSQFLHSLL